MKAGTFVMFGGLWASILFSATAVGEQLETAADLDRMELGRRMYMEGILPSGEMMSAQIQGDIRITGEQVICGKCHRRSGMGSTEGQQVVPAVTGDLLFNPLQLPTSQVQSAVMHRPAYTRETLKAAILGGVDANGEWLDPIMPRYPLDDASLDILIDYLTQLSSEHSPGVDDKEIHFATVISEGIGDIQKKALLDVLRAYVKQKNTETRHESERAANAPWHKEWVFQPYRKWVLHVWELAGSPDTWGDQLAAYYKEAPVYAVISGTVDGPWAPIHEFCESSKLPCLFPTTDLPVLDEKDFYSIYTDQGMSLEADGIASHMLSEGEKPIKVVQLYNEGDIKAETAANELELVLKDSGHDIQTVGLSGEADTANDKGIIPDDQKTLVVWGDGAFLNRVTAKFNSDQLPRRVYLTTRLFGVDTKEIPDAIFDRTYLIHSQELPDKLDRLLIRSTGWFKAKRIYAPEAKRIQANAYFAVKSAAGALKLARGYFFRDFFLEKIENMTDNANYTTVYPRVSLAPDQRFISRGFYIAKPSGKNKNRLEAVTEWSIP